MTRKALSQMTGEKQIRLAAKLYEARDSVRFLFADKFKERMAEGIKGLEDIASEHNLTVMEAALRMAKIYTAEDRGMAAMIIIAAAVEHVEPTA